MRRFALQSLLALGCLGALTGFKYEHHHITEAPIIDNSAPFYGSGLVIGPQSQLTGVVKKAPLSFRLYKFLMRKGDTQYVPGLRRESDCSVSEVYADLADYTVAATFPHFEQALRKAAGLSGPYGSYPAGCADSSTGTKATNLAGGRQPTGTLYGAGPDFHNEGAISIYLSDGRTLTDHHDIDIASDDPNASVDLLAVADLNGDGNPDYAVGVDTYGSGATGRIAILLGDGTGNYAAPSFLTLTPASNSSGVGGFVFGDFDGDGKLDLVAATQQAGGVRSSVFAHGHGDGTFDPPATVSTTAGLGSLAAADVNEDGHLDVISSDGTLLLGDGNGHFTGTESRFDGRYFAVGDFDGDGHLDLAVGTFNGDSGPLFIWRGDGTGHFTRIDPGYATGYGAGAADLVVTDIDGDGHPDLLVGAAGGGLYGASINSQGETEILLGRGDGTLAAPPEYDNGVLAMGDFDGNGARDLLATDTSTADHGVRPLLNDGQSQFRAGPLSPLGFNFFAGNLTAWVAADFNGDGKADLLAVQSGTPSGSLHVRLGNGDGTFQGTGDDITTSFNPGGYSYASASVPAVADFDGDGKVDVAMLGYGASAGALYELVGNGDGTLAAPAVIDASIVGDADQVSQVIAADLEGGGFADLVVADGGRPFDSPTVPGAMKVYRNSSGTFAAPATLPSTPAYPGAVAAGDVNGDGHLDLVVLGSDEAFGSGSMYVYLGAGDGTFAAPRITPLNDIYYFSVALADADGDGKLDVVVANCCGLTFASYARGDGTGNFAQPTILPLTVSPNAIALADLDGTGRPDLLIVSGSLTSDLRVFKNIHTDSIFTDGFEVGTR